MHSEPINMSSASAGLIQALARAQARARGVGKDRRNSQKGYDYASHDAVVAAGREAFSAEGVAFLSSWTHTPIESGVAGDIGNQFVCGTLTIHWSLSHGDGDAFGAITGSASMDMVASRARPPDKALAATLSYALGYVIRGLLLLDKNDGSDDVDQRDDAGGWHRQAPPRRSPDEERLIAMRQTMGAKLRQIRERWPDVPWRDHLDAALGRAWPEQPAAPEYMTAISYLERKLAEPEPVADAGEESDDGPA